MRYMKTKNGFVAYIVFALIVFGLLGIYLGYGWYIERYYICLYDGKMTRYLDIPPFSERTTSAKYELKGRCNLSVGSSSNQALAFLKSVCDNSGYVFNSVKNGTDIEIRRNYIVHCTLDGNKLKFSWKPVLTNKLKAKFKSAFPNEKLNEVKKKQKR